MVWEKQKAEADSIWCGMEFNGHLKIWDLEDLGNMVKFYLSIDNLFKKIKKLLRDHMWKNCNREIFKNLFRLGSYFRHREDKEAKMSIYICWTSFNMNPYF